MNKLILIACILLGLHRAQAATGGTNETVLRLAIELRDGSRIVGKSAYETLRFHSASLGDLKLPLAGIRSLEFNGSSGTARLTVTNGDVFAVVLVTETLRVETGFGKTELPVKLIRSVNVSPVNRLGDLAAGLVALWSAEGNGIDSAGGHNGTFPFGAAFARGVIGQAFDFDGSRRRLAVPDSPDFKLTTALTLSAWVYPRQYGGFITFRGDNRGGLDTWTLDTYQAGYVNFTIDDAENQTVSTRAPLQLNQWQLVTATWEHATGEMKLYVNGALGSQTNTDLVPIADLDGSPDAGVGIGNHSGTFHQFPFDGLIDEVRIYNRALADAEIQSLWTDVSHGGPLTQKTPLPVTTNANVKIQAAATNETGFRLTIELKDGSRITGKSPDDTLRFHSSSLGDMKLPLASIRAIEFAANSETARLTVTNGDVFAVQFSAANLRVETGFGKTELPVKLIRSVKVSPRGRIVQTQPGMVGLWSGEGDASDSAGENNATLAGNTTFTDGKAGQAFSFDGKNSFVKIPQSPNLNPGDQVTISFWMKADADNLMNSYQGLVTSDFYGVEISNGFGGQMGVNFNISTTANQPGLMENRRILWSGPPRGVTSVGDYTHISDGNGGGAPVSAGMWHHIAGTYDGAKLQLYVDGRAWGNSVPKTGAIAPMLANSFVAIGSEDGRTTCPDCVANRYFKGAIDEAAIYNRALSAAEIQAIYNGEQRSDPALTPQRPPPLPGVKTNVPTMVAATNETGFRLTIELKDGSRVTGKSPDDTLRFRSSSLGDLKLPLASIRSITFAGNAGSARLTATNGDVLEVEFAAAAVRVETSFGKTELPVKLIRSLKVAAMGRLGQLPPGLVALWSGEGDGNDLVGGNNMALTDISFVEGKVGRAFSFNGISSSIRIPASPALDLGAGEGFTVTAWIKPSDVDGFHPLFQWSNGSPMNCSIGLRPTENGVLMGNIAGAAQNHFVLSNPGTLVRGVFQHIALTYDKASGVGTWFLNGIVVAQRQLGSQIVASTKGDLFFSQRNTRQGDWSSNRSYAGLMDEIAIYNRALSAAEIQALCAEQANGEPLPLPAPSSGWFESWMR